MAAGHWAKYQSRYEDGTCSLVIGLEHDLESANLPSDRPELPDQFELRDPTEFVAGTRPCAGPVRSRGRPEHTSADERSDQLQESDR